MSVLWTVSNSMKAEDCLYLNAKGKGLAKVRMMESKHRVERRILLDDSTSF